MIDQFIDRASMDCKVTDLICGYSHTMILQILDVMLTNLHERLSYHQMRFSLMCCPKELADRPIQSTPIALFNAALVRWDRLHDFCRRCSLLEGFSPAGPRG